MKKTIKAVLLVLTVALLAFSFTACVLDEPEDNTPEAETSDVIEVGNQNSGKIITLVIGGTEEKVYSVDFSDIEIKEGVYSVIKSLAEKELLTYKANDSGYGAYLTELGELKEDAATATYLFVYTSVVTDFDVSEWASTKAWGDVTLTSTGVGITEMTVENGAVIYVGTVSYGA